MLQEIIVDDFDANRFLPVGGFINLGSISLSDFGLHVVGEPFVHDLHVLCLPINFNILFADILIIIRGVFNIYPITIYCKLNQLYIMLNNAVKN